MVLPIDAEKVGELTFLEAFRIPMLAGGGWCGHPMEDIDIWRAANLLIQKHGERAEWEATRLGDLAIERGDPKGERVWVEVLKAIKVLIVTKSPGPLN